MELAKRRTSELRALSDDYKRSLTELQELVVLPDIEDELARRRAQRTAGDPAGSGATNRSRERTDRPASRGEEEREHVPEHQRDGGEQECARHVPIGRVDADDVRRS